MTFTSFLSDRRAVRDRGEWFIELYPKNLLGVETILRFSRRGTTTGAAAITVGSDTIPAHTPYRKRLIKAPTLTQSLWQPGRILSSSLPSFGSVVFTNKDGGLDQYRGWTFSGCRFKVFFADRYDIAGTIGKVSDGIMGQPKWSLGELEVLLNGRESLFNVPISERVYRGTSYMLELFGDRTVSYGAPSAINLTTSMTAEVGWLWIDAAPTAGVIFWGWIGTPSPWRIFLTSSLRLNMAGSVGGVTQSITTSTILSIQRSYHVAIAIAARDVIFYIWDDDNQTLTTETFTGVFSSSTRDSVGGGINYQFRSGGDATLRIWCDESRVWNYARTPEELKSNRFRPLSGSVPASCVHCTGFDNGSGLVVTDSSATAAHGTISGAGDSTWLWAHEGGPELAGTPKPDVYGERFGVAPVLVDPTGVNGAAGYQVAGGGTINDIDSFEGGLLHTSFSAASLRAYITTAPVAGLFSGNVSLQYLSRGLFKLGSSPVLPVSATVKGYSGGALGYVNKADTIARDVITRRGPKLVDPTGIDTESFTAYASANPGIVGVFIPSSKPIREILDLLMVSGAGWWGYVRASILFHLEKFAGPSTTPDYRFTSKHIISVDPIPPSAVIYKVIVRYRENNVVLSENQVAASVKGTTNWQLWTKQWLEEPATDDVLREAYPGEASIPFVVETGLQYAADARALADYLLALLKGPKDGWTTTVTADGLQATIGETATQEVTLQRGVERLDQDGSKAYVVLGVGDNRQQGTVQVTLWGGDVEAV